MVSELIHQLTSPDAMLFIVYYNVLLRVLQKQNILQNVDPVHLSWVDRRFWLGETYAPMLFFYITAFRVIKWVILALLAYKVGVVFSIIVLAISFCSLMLFNMVVGLLVGAKPQIRMILEFATLVALVVLPILSGVMLVRLLT